MGDEWFYSSQAMDYNSITPQAGLLISMIPIHHGIQAVCHVEELPEGLVALAPVADVIGHAGGARGDVG